MSQGAAICSSADIQREELLALVREVAVQVRAEVIDFRGLSDPDSPTAGLGSSRIRLSRGREFTFLHMSKRTDEANGLDPFLARMSQRVGEEQHTLVTMDMNSLALALEFAYGFARRWPCLFSYGDRLLSNQQLFENERMIRSGNIPPGATADA